MNNRCLPLVICLVAALSTLTAAESKSQAPRAEVVKPQPASSSASRVTAADLELVRRIFQTESSRPMDWGRPSSDKEILSDSGVAWQSYWWDGANALYNTSGLVITGTPDFSEKWKPYALIGLEDQITFERHGRKRQGHLGLGVEYALTESVGLFTEFRAVATSGLPTEGLARAGIHLIY